MNKQGQITVKLQSVTDGGCELAVGVHVARDGEHGGLLGAVGGELRVLDLLLLHIEGLDVRVRLQPRRDRTVPRVLHLNAKIEIRTQVKKVEEMNGD